MVNIVTREEYGFLKAHKRLGKNMILLTLGGSHAYGTNVEGSDIDVRGCALNSKEEILLGQDFEQVIDNTTDTVVYSFHKLIGLLAGCNPNIIEMLGCKPEHYILLSDTGKELLNNKKLFLSQKAVNSFGGYANQQLRRLLNALARDSYTQKEKERHIALSCESAMHSFSERYQEIPEGSIKLSVSASEKEELEQEIFVDANLSHYPLRDFHGMISDFSNILRNYNKINHRNNKKDELHLNKHAMHLIRLYLMCFDILEKEEINTYREKEREFLLSIRNGKFMKEDGSYRSEFFEMVNEYEKRLEYAKENTALPKEPDMKKIGEFVMEINEKVVKEAL